MKYCLTDSLTVRCNVSLRTHVYQVWLVCYWFVLRAWCNCLGPLMLSVTVTWRAWLLHQPRPGQTEAATSRLHQPLVLGPATNLTPRPIYLVTSVHIWWHHSTSGDISHHLVTSQKIWWYQLTSSDISHHLVTSVNICSAWTFLR